MNSTYQNIKNGATAKSDKPYVISEEIYLAFIKGFKDTNSLHTDDIYAKNHGFNQKVMHGAILNGFLSHYIGITFPGKSAFLLSTDMGYTHPSYLNDEITIESKVIQKVDSQHIIVVAFKFFNQTQKQFVGRAKSQIRILDNEKK